jgi:phenylacetate-coenzyme A ligase PaaK-like adenylate-forming protein
MNVIGALRAYRLRPLVRDQEEFYSRNWMAEEIRTWQLEQFNEQWQSIRQNVPYFARLSREQDLPPQFESWIHIQDALPVIDRETVQQHGEALASTTRSPDFQRITGGSTAEPIQIPAWSSERRYERQNFWYARRWYDISPADRLFLIWGHSHIFGEGFRGWWNKVKRQIKDRLLGYYRANAYDLSDDALRRAGRELIQTRPDYVLGYSSALDQLAQVNEDRRNEFRRLDLKAVIATAESFPRPDSEELIGDVFGAPVAMEYGTVETGPIAYQAPNGDFQVFWRHYKIEGKQTEPLDGAYEIYVTSLYPRCFPLVRYRVGDMVRQNPNASDFDQTLSSIIGRCNDYIELSGGRCIHSETFTHVIKEIENIQAYQVRQKEDGEVKMCYVNGEEGQLGAQEEEKIRRRLSRIDPELGRIKISAVNELDQTPAGKTKRIVRE